MSPRSTPETIIAAVLSVAAAVGAFVRARRGENIVSEIES